MISDEAKARMNAALAKVRADEPAIAALMELPGIGRALSRRIVDFYGPTEALRVVRETPYKLIQDIDGISFEKADTIALSCGLPPDSEARIEAGVVFSIDQLCNKSGHVYTTRAELLHTATRLLGVPQDLVVNAVGALVEKNRIVVEMGEDRDGNPAEGIYTWAAHHTEESVADMLHQILETPVRERKGSEFALARSVRKSLPEAIEQTIASFERRSGYALSESQVAAVRAATSKVLVITGGPGTGKTTVTRAVIDSYRAAGLNCVLAAPTGRAAKRMGESTGYPASTIHRLLGLKPGRRPLYDRNLPLPADVVLLDETSMVDMYLMRKVLDAVAPHSRLVLIGDVDQLPSIGPGAVLRDVIASGAIPTVRLSQVFRQAKGSSISVNAQRINGGDKPESDDNEFHMVDETKAEIAADAVVDYVARRLPALFNLDPVRDVQVLCPAKKGVDGVDALNKRLQDILNPLSVDRGPGVVVELFGFRVGDKVIHTDKNDYQKDVMNGDVGFVSKVDPTKVYVRYDDREVPYDKDDICYLKLAYALTIHKSQGGEYKAVVMPMLGPDIMLSRNMLYTGVTRGKSVVVLISNDAAVRRALSEVKRERRNTRLAARLQAA